MRLILKAFLLAAFACFVGFWLITRPAALPEDWGAGLEADPEAGALVMAAAGCASCHEAPAQDAPAPKVLSGGKSFPSDFGIFYAPNISSDPEHGIGGWTLQEFARAVTLGVSPDGKHYYPAFPYTSYALADPQDIVNLFAFLQTLPASNTPNTPNDLALPFSIRRSVGVWKAIYTQDEFFTTGDLSPELERGRYLAEALGHCAECHTPRTILGGLDKSKWMRGAPDPSGVGRIPDITAQALDWSLSDLQYYFETGFTPDYDSAGGGMAEVIENISQLPESDLGALAAYVKTLR